MSLPFSLRTQGGEERYQEAKHEGKLVALKDVVPINAWKYWKLIPNTFPYNEWFDVHDMLVPKRQFAQRGEMNVNELAELHQLQQELEYDMFMENTWRKQSVLDHYHIHCCVYRSQR